MADSPIFIGSVRHEPVQFVPSHSTRPRPLWTPGASGSEIRKITIATNDSGNNKLQIGIARRLTLASAMGSGALVDNGASADTITRSSGSFLTDGWLEGNRLLLLGATTLANDFEVILTAAAALSLTLATGGGTVNTAEGLPSTAKLCLLTWMHYLSVPLGSGLPDVVAVAGMSTTQNPSLDASPDRLITLGPNDILVGKVGTALGTGEVLDVLVEGGDF